MPQSGTVVSHLVGGARNVTGFGDVSVVSLVDAVETEQVSGWACGGGGMLVMPYHRWDVVAKGQQRPASTIHHLGYDVLLGNQTC